MILLLLASLAIAEPDAKEPVPTCQLVGTQTPLVKLDLEQGYFKWVSKADLPRTLFVSRGPMVARIYENWVAVQQNDGECHVVPRDLVLYVGNWDGEDD